MTKRLIKSSCNLTHAQKIAVELNKKNIRYALLKGCFLLECIYDEISDRPINDIDILVSDSDVSDVVQIAKNFGFNFLASSNNKALNHYHILPMIHEDKLSKLEIHTKIFKSKEISASELLNDRLVIEKDDKNLFFFQMN